MEENDELISNQADIQSTSALDKKELESLESLTLRYEKMSAPNPIAGAISEVGNKINGLLPDVIKKGAANAAASLSGQDLFIEAGKVIATGFKTIEEQAARVSVSEETVLQKLNNVVPDREIRTLEEACYARSYDIAKITSKEKLPNLGIAFTEGAATGAPGFAGVPFNIVLSTFCYYRAVQSTAMFYGYDVKNNPAELIIAGEVFSSAMAPTSAGSNEISSIIGKIMLISEAQVVGQTVKKGWPAMAARGGASLLITQMRALANRAAKKALEKAGKEGLENAVFRSIFEQLGKQLSQKTVQRAVPVVSALIGALFDTGQMNKILDFADIFYQKRFISEKQERQNSLSCRQA